MYGTTVNIFATISPRAVKVKETEGKAASLIDPVHFLPSDVFSIFHSFNFDIAHT